VQMVSYPKSDGPRKKLVGTRPGWGRVPSLQSILIGVVEIPALIITRPILSCVIQRVKVLVLLTVR
jgi:hypothetical protein